MSVRSNRAKMNSFPPQHTWPILFMPSLAPLAGRGGATSAGGDDMTAEDTAQGVPRACHDLYATTGTRADLAPARKLSLSSVRVLCAKRVQDPKSMRAPTAIAPQPVRATRRAMGGSIRSLRDTHAHMREFLWVPRARAHGRADRCRFASRPQAADRDGASHGDGECSAAGSSEQVQFGDRVRPSRHTHAHMREFL